MADSEVCSRSGYFACIFGRTGVLGGVSLNVLRGISLILLGGTFLNILGGKFLVILGGMFLTGLRLKQTLIFAVLQLSTSRQGIARTRRQTHTHTHARTYRRAHLGAGNEAHAVHFPALPQLQHLAALQRPLDDSGACRGLQAGAHTVCACAVGLQGVASRGSHSVCMRSRPAGCCKQGLTQRVHAQ